MLVTLTLIGIVAVSAYMYGRYKHSFWSSLGVQSPPAVPFMGHIHKLGESDAADWMQNEVYEKYCKSGYCGLYELFNPVLMVGDMEMIKLVLVKDFDHFTDRRISESTHEVDKALGDMLSNLNGQKWKHLRTIMSPAFTSGKLRGMFEILCEKADIATSYSLQESNVDIKDVASRYVIDAIASCAFGFESDSISDRDSIFLKRTALFSDFSSPIQIAKIIVSMVAPKVLSLLNIPLLDRGVLFFNDILKEAIAERRKGVKRGDFLDLLLEVQAQEKESSSSETVLDDDMIVAQSVLFLVAGYDTTASAIAFCCHLLAKYPEEQQRLRQELLDLVEKHDGLTYQAIMEAKFLEGSVMEALRLFPPVYLTERQCTKTYQFPGTNITLEPGRLVQIPLHAIQRDAALWPEPDVFKPERFLPENKNDIVNYSYLPFGSGPRNCIGMRFALLEAKIAVAKLILKANLELIPGEEIKISYKAGFLKAENGVQVRLTPINEE